MRRGRRKTKKKNKLKAKKGKVKRSGGRWGEREQRTRILLVEAAKGRTNQRLGRSGRMRNGWFSSFFTIGRKMQKILCLGKLILVFLKFENILPTMSGVEYKRKDELSKRRNF